MQFIAQQKWPICLNIGDLRSGVRKIFILGTSSICLRSKIARNLYSVTNASGGAKMS
jgi:hypothetical protein